jgi:hypothetical protein
MKDTLRIARFSGYQQMIVAETASCFRRFDMFSLIPPGDQQRSDRGFRHCPVFRENLGEFQRRAQ